MARLSEPLQHGLTSSSRESAERVRWRCEEEAGQVGDFE